MRVNIKRYTKREIDFILNIIIAVVLYARGINRAHIIQFYRDDVDLILK